MTTDSRLYSTADSLASFFHRQKGLFHSFIDKKACSRSDCSNPFNSIHFFYSTMTLNHKQTIQRRNSIPQELEDPEDCTIGEGQGDLFEPPSTSLPLTVEVPAPQPASPLANPTTPISWQSIPREIRNLVAGGLAGMLAKSVVAPVDRIKILYQVSSAEFHLTRIPRVMLNIIHEEGLSALWKGNMATMIRVFPYSGIQFMVFDRCKRFFLSEQEQQRAQQQSSSPPPSTAQRSSKHGLTAMESLVSGMIAGSISVLCTYPLDLTRAQLAVLKRHKKQAIGQAAIPTQSFGSVLRQNYSKGGIRGLFRGISPTLLGILPYSGIAFTLNEQGKRHIQSLTHRDLTTMERMQCGAFAGLFAQTATYPIEVTRRRMQTGDLVASSQDTALGCLDGSGTKKRQTTNAIKPPTTTATTSSSLPRHPTTMQSTVLHLYREQGIRGFYKGVSMNWMKGPIAFSISFTTFDTVQGLMETEAERAQRLPRRFTDEEPSFTTSTTRKEQSDRCG